MLDARELPAQDEHVLDRAEEEQPVAVDEAPADVAVDGVSPGLVRAERPVELRVERLVAVAEEVQPAGRGEQDPRPEVGVRAVGVLVDSSRSGARSRLLT